MSARTIHGVFLTALISAHSAEGVVSGPLRKWCPVKVDFAGPRASETDGRPNPFLDYRLRVEFTGPGGERYTVPGFFAGDGRFGGTGSVWRAAFAPDAAGRWTYVASFRKGPGVAVETDARAGRPAGFDGQRGSFTVAERDPGAPGFLKWGRLEYVGGHYLKFRDGPHWIKGGTDSPENLLAYAGFDDTIGSHDYRRHVGDWRRGDPDWGGGRGKGIIGALNYLASMRVNSVYFLPMNIGGDGKDVWPYVGPIERSGSPENDNLHFDVSKLAQWDIVFSHAQRKGIYLHFVLNEAEKPNKRELDGAELGVERKLYYREMVARFAHHPALQWNLCEEYDLALPIPPSRIKEFAGHIGRLDPYDHPVTVHQCKRDLDRSWGPFVGDDRFSITSFQKDDHPAGTVRAWRRKTAAAGRPIPIGMDEFVPHLKGTAAGSAETRKRFLWNVLLSGGYIEFITAGLLRNDDFRAYERMWKYTWHARRFMEENLPFWEMEDADELLSGESAAYEGGQVFAKRGEVYAVYLPEARPSGTLDLTGARGAFEKRWYDPRRGGFRGRRTTVKGGIQVPLGAPPGDAAEDWALLLRRSD